MTTHTNLHTEEERIREYRSIHYWLRRNHGTPSECEFSDCEKVSKIFDWALKQGMTHARDRNNYFRLCRKCHIRYDWTEEKKKCLVKVGHSPLANKRRSQSMRGHSVSERTRRVARATFSKPVYVIINNRRTLYASQELAAQAIGMDKSYISKYVLNGKRTNKGYRFKRLNATN